MKLMEYIKQTPLWLVYCMGKGKPAGNGWVFPRVWVRVQIFWPSKNPYLWLQVQVQVTSHRAVTSGRSNGLDLQGFSWSGFVCRSNRLDLLRFSCSRFAHRSNRLDLWGFSWSGFVCRSSDVQGSASSPEAGKAEPGRASKSRALVTALKRSTCH